MEDLELEENQERRANGDPQALQVHLGREGIQASLGSTADQAPRGRLAAKDHGEMLDRRVKMEQMEHQEKGASMDLQDPPENLDSLARMELLVLLEHRAVRVNAEIRVPQDSQVLPELMVLRDREEDLGREVLWETADQ